MFRNTFVRDFLTVLNSDGPRPLHLWKLNIKNGFLKRVWDEDLGLYAIEIQSSNVSECWISSIADLGISLPYLVFGLRSTANAYFTFKITVKDDCGMHRRVRFSNFESRQRRDIFQCSLPLCIGSSWEYIRIDLPSLIKQAFNATYVETSSIAIHANCRVRSVYFAKMLVSHEDLPPALSLQPRSRPKNSRRVPMMSRPFADSTCAPPTTPAECPESSDDDEESCENSPVGNSELDEWDNWDRENGSSVSGEEFTFDPNLDVKCEPIN